MGKEIRTTKGTLLGKFDEGTSILTIKNGNKIISIVVPTEGLNIYFDTGNEITDNFYVKA